MLRHRFVPCEKLEWLALLLDESCERRAARRVRFEMIAPERTVQLLERTPLHVRDVLVVDERCGAQRFELRRGRCVVGREFGNGGRIDIESVEKETTRRSVRARRARIARMQRVQRIDADAAGTGTLCRLCERAQDPRSRRCPSCVKNEARRVESPGPRYAPFPSPAADSIAYAPPASASASTDFCKSPASPVSNPIVASNARFVSSETMVSRPQ